MANTKVVTYYSEKSMKRGIQHEEKAGWQVVNVATQERGRGFIKGCLFGIFTLFMKKPVSYLVTFRRST